MDHSTTNNKLIEQVLKSTKTIAIVGVSSVKNELDPKVTRRKPSIIVMKYLQEFGYKILPVNPSSAGKKIQGEITFAKLEDISTPVDIVNVFRPSKETPEIANQAVKVGTKVLWLQYGIQNEETKKIAQMNNIAYISNKCIKQEYQRLFLKMSPVFPALKTD